MQPTVHSSSRWFSSAGQQELYGPFPDFSQERQKFFRKQSLLQYNLVPYAAYFQLATQNFHPPPQEHWKHQAEMSWQQRWAEAIRCHRKSSHLHVYPGLLCLNLITGKPWCVFPHWFSRHQWGAQGCCEGHQRPEEPWEGKFPGKLTSRFLNAEHLKRGALENIQETIKRRRKTKEPKGDSEAIDLIIHDLGLLDFPWIPGKFFLHPCMAAHIRRNPCDEGVSPQNLQPKKKRT